MQLQSPHRAHCLSNVCEMPVCFLSATHPFCCAVRFREYCLLDEEGSWTNEGLPAALDYVLANHVKPAVLVIDAW